MINVFVDDLRELPKGFDVLCKDYDTALECLLNNEVNILSLDNDLGVNKDGSLVPDCYMLVKTLMDKGFTCKRFMFHTDNVVGFENMKSYLNSAKKVGLLSKAVIIDVYKTEAKSMYADGKPFKEVTGEV